MEGVVITEYSTGFIDNKFYKEWAKIKKKLFKKEVRKVNKIPYFELKVVRAKKAEKPIVSSKEWTPDYCPCCGQRTVEEKRGNWVNDENLDEIKFPCFCSFSHPRLKDLRYGIITNTGYHCGYALIDVGSQSLGVHLMNTQNYLDKLIKEWDIHILKGKIIIFDEEEEK